MAKIKQDSGDAITEHLKDCGAGLKKLYPLIAPDITFDLHRAWNAKGAEEISAIILLQRSTSSSCLYYIATPNGIFAVPEICVKNEHQTIERLPLWPSAKEIPDYAWPLHLSFLLYKVDFKPSSI